MLVAGEDAFAPLDIRVRVKGGGHTSQVYALRQAIAKALIAYYAKYIDAYSAMELKKKLVAYDRTLLIADPRRMEPKKFGGHGARARRQKRYESLHKTRSCSNCLSQLSLSNTFIILQFHVYFICHHVITICIWHMKAFLTKAVNHMRVCHGRIFFVASVCATSVLAHVLESLRLRSIHL